MRCCKICYLIANVCFINIFWREIINNSCLIIVVASYVDILRYYVAKCNVGEVKVETMQAVVFIIAAHLRLGECPVSGKA